MDSATFLSKVREGSGTVEDLNQLISVNGDINAVDNVGNSALFYSISNNDDELFSSLMESGSNINYKNKDGWTVLMKAAARNNIEHIKSLASKGALLNETSFQQETAVIIAAERGNKRALETLLDIGACKYHEARLFTAIHLPTLAFAIYRGSHVESAVLDTALSLIELSKHDMFIQSCLDFGFGALHLAAISGVLDLDSLRGKGLEVDPLTEAGRTPLMLAAQSNNLPCVKWLVEHDANIQHSDTYGVTVLHLATATGHTKIVEYLLKEGACVDAVDNTGLTSLMFATYFNHEQTIEVLLSSGADASVGSKAGISVLHISAFQNKKTIIELFASKGLPLDVVTEDGRTALMYCIPKSCINALKALISAGADVNGKDMNGWTALHYSCIFGNLEVTTILLDKGADVNTVAQKTNEVIEEELNCSMDDDEVSKSVFGIEWVPLTVASLLSKVDIVRLLLGRDAGAAGKADTALISCIGGAILKKFGYNDGINNYADIVSLLAAHGADVNCKTYDGSSMLMFASTHGLERIVVRLLELGADPLFRKEDNTTALGLATRNHQEKVVKILQDWIVKVQPHYRGNFDEVDAAPAGPATSAKVIDQLYSDMQDMKRLMSHMQSAMRTQMSPGGDPTPPSITSSVGNYFSGDGEVDQELAKLAEDLGPEWKDLAISLGFNSAQVSHFESVPGDVPNHITSMLMKWRNTVADKTERDKILSEALKNSCRRYDLAEKITKIDSVDRPSEKKTLLALSSSLGAEWKPVAIYLRVPSGVIEQKQMQHKVVKDQIYAVLLVWARGPMPKPWKSELEFALREVGRIDLADSINIL
ncbi:uncharacterized protein [Antedon mediterranea]|uniref:uncharacterized protein n=1 Tax=Antedon mediterranea TaxID=105859 RepID=UPI003AF875BF